MNYRMIGYFLSIVLLIEGALMAFPMLVALCYRESILPFLYTVLIIAAVGLPSVIFKPKKTRIYAREGFVCVALSWILLSVFGALPFMFSGAIPNFFDAFFESVSGFTTTGSSVVSDVSVLTKSLIFWRCLSNWVGGMGVLMFMLAILPSDDGRSVYLMRAEVPGPTKGKLVPRMRKTAMILYGIYFALTVTEIIALLCTGFSFFDAVINSLATAGTGGFTAPANSTAGYENPAAEWIIAVFMLIFGVNFNLYYLVLIKDFRSILKNDELKAYLGVVIVAVTAIAVNIWKVFDSGWHAIRAAFFQVATVISTTGFVTEDFGLWPTFSKTVLILLMILGACGGSTAGGIKLSRVLILLKNGFREIKHTLRPNSVNRIKQDGEILSEEVVRSANRYLILYTAVSLISFLLISIDGMSVETNLTAMLSCFNNIGPALGEITPFGCYVGYSWFSTLVLALDMLLGRLEIMPFLILCTPATWKKR